MTEENTQVSGDAAASDTTAAGEPGSGAPAQAPADPAQAIAALSAEVANLKDAFLRAKAETENVRRQMQSEVAKAHKFAIERFAEGLLPARDSLETTLATDNVGLETLRSGVELTLKQLAAAFERSQVVEINPAGERFDPHRHQAIAMIESEVPANTVVQVFQKGYLLADRVLRPATVAVSKGGSTA